MYEAVYVAVSLIWRAPSDDPALADTNVGLLLNDISLPLPSVNVSAIETLLNTKLPLFLTVIVYVIISFASLRLLELTSFIENVFVTSKDGIGLMSTSVLSFTVFPSVSSPSSLISDTSLVLPGLLPVAEAVFDMLPLFKTEASII